MTLTTSVEVTTGVSAQVLPTIYNTATVATTTDLWQEIVEFITSLI